MMYHCIALVLICVALLVRCDFIKVHLHAWWHENIKSFNPFYAKTLLYLDLEYAATTSMESPF